jgi:hypothetical protein
VSVTDYVVDILLILVIFRAVRPHRLTVRAAVLPLVLLIVAGIIYLRPVTLRGNDLALILILAAAGIILGVISGLADRIWRDEHQQLLSRAVTVSERPPDVRVTVESTEVPVSVRKVVLTSTEPEPEYHDPLMIARSRGLLIARRQGQS